MKFSSYVFCATALLVSAVLIDAQITAETIIDGSIVGTPKGTPLPSGATIRNGFDSTSLLHTILNPSPTGSASHSKKASWTQSPTSSPSHTTSSSPSPTTSHSNSANSLARDPKVYLGLGSALALLMA